MPEWTVRFFREGDEEGFLSVLMAAFPSWPAAAIDVSPLEHLRWKLSSHPLAYRYHVVAEADGRIVGVRLVLVRGTMVDGEVRLSYTGYDNAIHPDFQGRGLLSELVPFRFDEMKDVFTMKFGLLTNIPSSKATQRRIGAELFGNHLRALIAPPGLAAFSEEHPTCRVRAVPRFDDRVDPFWAAAAEPFRFIFPKDASFANWRYADRRAGPFSIKLAEDGDELLGFTVVRMLRGSGVIVDLLALPERTDVVQALVCDAARTLSQAGANEVECTLPRNHPYRKPLRRLGFQTGKRRVFPNFVPGLLTAERLAFLTDPEASIHMVLGDFDLV